VAAAMAWPIFPNASALRSDPWGKYFEVVYGEIPKEGYPIDLKQFWMFYDNIIVEAKANSASLWDLCPPPFPTLLSPVLHFSTLPGLRYMINNAYQSPFTSWVNHPGPWNPIPAKTWVEVVHKKDPWGDEAHGMWMLYAKGSGIYFYTGNTVSFNEHADAYLAFGISGCGFGLCDAEMSIKAAMLGYDSVQFMWHQDGGNYPCYAKLGPSRSHGGIMNFEILSTNLIGAYACGSPTGVGFRSGWQASRPCVCNNNLEYLNCQHVPLDGNSQSVSRSRLPLKDSLGFASHDERPQSVMPLADSLLRNGSSPIPVLTPVDVMLPNGTRSMGSMTLV